MRYLTLSSLLLLFLLSSCKKDGPPGQGAGHGGGGDGQGQEPPVNTPGAPNLPATPYDYVNTRNNMPPYMKAFLSGRTDLDNTPAGNPITNAGATLGRVLFYDKNMSVNNTRSCGSCHHQDKAFTDGLALSPGFDNQLTRRNAMTVVNQRFFGAKTMFWDMRAASLETQTTMPILDHIEMGMPSLTALETKLSAIAYYKPLFKAAFGDENVTAPRISQALSQFIRSIVSFQSKYDQGLASNLSNLSADEKNGLRLLQVNFCTECHSDLATSQYGQLPSFLIADNTGLNTGIGSNNGLEADYTDKGIGGITHKPADMGTFKIPGLRNVALTAPYMHDGRFATLEAVMEHYNHGIKGNPNLGIQLSAVAGSGVPLTTRDKSDIIAFLKTLTDEQLISDPKYADPFK
ncbi:cytochrome-c peroxidase [Chitinophaga oryzae]|uniref:Cytochrome-c peroxidase n=1 Tax=Chitinophaga oryzae TaxID=2725414 RepID=A0AAE6ZJ87_9BACT|nr:cytochrome c peroxidase [Chitinophaga oryzae]QJB32404.1 cytochrome-c peroxidase [Chitinophaga oryzae]QJB38878.1 cytochrome-c peroxidase [Chitinophaga oryzae]